MRKLSNNYNKHDLIKFANDKELKKEIITKLSFSEQDKHDIKHFRERKIIFAENLLKKYGFAYEITSPNGSHRIYYNGELIETSSVMLMSGEPNLSDVVLQVLFYITSGLYSAINEYESNKSKCSLTAKKENCSQDISITPYLKLPKKEVEKILSDFETQYKNLPNIESYPKRNKYITGSLF